MSRQDCSKSHRKNRKSLKVEKKKRFHKKQNKKYLKKLVWSAYANTINGLHQLYHQEVKAENAPLLLQGIGDVLQNNQQLEGGKRIKFLNFLKQVLRPETIPLLYAPIALYNIFRFRKYWINTLESWQPVKHWNPTHKSGGFEVYEAMLKDLLQHLFVKHTMPEFMYPAWQAQHSTHLWWFVHLGKGGNIKDVRSLPFKLNSKMAHYFTQAPRHYSIEKALLYGQVCALGGTEAFFEQWHATHWKRIYKDPLFFRQVIQFFAYYPELTNNREVAQVISFINAHKYDGQKVYTRAKGIVHEPPVAPNFSLKGRTDQSIMRLVDEWLSSPRVLSSVFDDSLLVWTPDPTNDFEYWDVEKQVLYKISQLINNYELWLEGKAMMHCVGTYTHKCLGGYSTIWTMTKVNGQGKEEKCVTIEMGKKWRICEIRGKRNREPKPQEMEVIKQWVNKENLALSIDYL
ncbi:PcfJ domain-containing protein [uncultured Microscilla sp.]|uniref:PcfJ domain-containing protein n=1 Tax=uncultured Microscilla sp. TaxID=432653 RepID=UPI00260F4C94|nr:PcfJ domain-containing protein [uncultured Microscilla sp.]